MKQTLEDISNISPAVTFNNVGPGKSNFYIRGVSDGAIMNSYASPEATTALYIDPYWWNNKSSLSFASIAALLR